MGLCFLCRKKRNFHLKWPVLLNSEQYFLSVSSPENVEFSACSCDLVDVENVHLGNSEYSVRNHWVDKLFAALLHCKCKQSGVLNFKTLQNLGGQFALASPTPNSGGTRDFFALTSR